MATAHALRAAVAAVRDATGGGVTHAVETVGSARVLAEACLGSSVPARDIPRLVALHKAGRLPVERLLTHRLGLDELNEGFDRLARGEAVRQAVIL